MKALINKLTEKYGSLVSGTLIVTVGVFLGSVFSYLLQFALGRLLSVSDYGTFNAFLAVANILGVPSAVLGMSLTKLVTELKVKNNYEHLTQLFWEFSAFSFGIGFLFFLLLILAKNSLSSYLNISDSNVVYFFGLFIIEFFVLVVPTSYLQGLLRFKAFAFSSVVSGFIRFAIPVIFVLLGWKVNGSFAGLALASLLAFGLNVLLLKSNFVNFNREVLKHYYKKVLLFSLPVLFVNLGMILLNNLDVILVKRFFDEVTAGYYAGVVTVCKVLLFGAGTIVVVMFPQISELHEKGESYQQKFNLFFLLQLGVALVGVLVFVLAPKLITHIMFGSRFEPSIAYIPLFAVFIGFYILINFMTMFLLAVGKTKVFLFMIPGVIAQFILINLFHSSLYEVIRINIFVSVFLFVSIFLYYLLNVSFNNRTRL